MASRGPGWRRAIASGREAIQGAEVWARARVRRWGPGGLLLAVVLMGTALVGATRFAGWLGRLEMFQLEGFRLEGSRFLEDAEVASIVSWPVGVSVWDDAEPWIAELRDHPLIERLRVRRNLPDSIVIEVEEREPVAFVPTPTLEPVDRDGRPLPIDPARHRLDLPLLRLETDPAEAGPPTLQPLTRELERLGRADPAFLGMLSELVWGEDGDAVAWWGQPAVEIRFRPPLTAERLRRTMIVMTDATNRYPERRLRYVDLRYADQVVVRF